MSLLVSFVRFLNDDELNKLKRMPLSGKEKKMMQVLADQHAIAEIPKKEMLCLLDISSSHYDKIGAVVLKKAYRELAGDDELEQLNFLSKKFMFRHLFHEIRHLAIKVQRHQVDNAERGKYLQALFNFSINVPAKYYDEKFVEQNAANYLNEVSQNREAKELEIKSKMLFGQLNKLTQQAPDTRTTGKILKEVKYLEKKYCHVDQVGAKAVLYHVMVNYYRLVEINAGKREHYLKKIAALYNGFENLPPFEKKIAECHYAEMMYERGEHRLAFQKYRQLFAHHMPLLKNQFHHFARCIELAIILDEFAVAQRMLDTLFKIYIVNRHETTGVLGAMLYGQLFLKMGLPEKAFEYLSIAKTLNSIQVYFHYEIKLRILEVFYFAFSGDFDFVIRLSQRNIRYIQLQNLSLKRYKYAHCFYLLKDIKKLTKINSGDLPPKIKSYLNEFQIGYELQIGQLLNKLLVQPS